VNPRFISRANRGRKLSPSAATDGIVQSIEKAIAIRIEREFEHDRSNADLMVDVMDGVDGAAQFLNSLADQLRTAKNRMATAILSREDFYDVLAGAMRRATQTLDEARRRHAPSKRVRPRPRSTSARRSLSDPTGFRTSGAATVDELTSVGEQIREAAAVGT
jgi:hypothetical protein